MMAPRLAISGLLAVFLAGCGTTRIPDVVRVPVPVPCEVAVPAEPEWAVVDLTPRSTIYEKVRALLAERRQRVAYEAQLRATIEACRSPLEAPSLRQ